MSDSPEEDVGLVQGAGNILLFIPPLREPSSFPAPALVLSLCLSVWWGTGPMGHVSALLLGQAPWSRVSLHPAWSAAQFWLSLLQPENSLLWS